MTYRFEVRTGNGEPRASTVGRNGGVCVFTGSPMSLEYIRVEGKAGRFETRLMAIVVEGEGGRTYLPASTHQEQVANTARPSWTIEQELPDNPRWFSPPLYGFRTYGSLFTRRQLLSLTTLSDLIAPVCFKARHDTVSAKASPERAKIFGNAVGLYLSFAISKTLTRNCTLAIWERGMGRLAGALGRQAMPMQYDFAETNLFAGAWTPDS